MNQDYIRQLLAGRDFAKSHPVASQMQNFSYLIGDMDEKICFVVDPAWNVGDLVNIAQNDGMQIIGILATHHHQDHIGGEFYGFNIEGVKKLLEINPCPIHSHKLDAAKVAQNAGLLESKIVAHESGDKILIGKTTIEVIHTPGHTPGSCCFKTAETLFGGDTLFVQGCGRTDMPDSNSNDMFKSLNQTLAKLPGELMLYPGHAYGGEKELLSQVRLTNPFLQVNDLKTWQKYQGG